MERFTGAGPPKPSDCAGMRGIKGRSDAAPSPAAPPLSSEFNKSRAARESLFGQKMLGDLFAVLGSLYPSHPKML